MGTNQSREEASLFLKVKEITAEVDTVEIITASQEEMLAPLQEKGSTEERNINHYKTWLGQTVSIHSYTV